MKKIIMFCIIFLLHFSTPLSATILNPYNGHYYERIDTRITWTDAKSEAEGLSYMDVDGHLATITSDEENWWIVDNLGGPLTLDHWLGGSFYDGNWTWVTGEPWSYTNWWPGEPNGGGVESGLQFDDAEKDPPVPGYWNDIGVWANEDGYIVEFDTQPTPVPVPEPSTLLLTGLSLIIASRYRKKLKGIKN